VEWTIRRVLDWTAKDFAARDLASPRLDAELIIAESLGVERIQLYLEYDRPLEASELERIRSMVERRRKREPVAYLLGYRDFYGRRFEVDQAVLIPRPDTETLIDRALVLLPLGEVSRALDLCTGSGAIAITLAAERPALAVIATDISKDALRVADRNASSLGVQERVTFFEGDLFDALPKAQHFAIITANPPYIPAPEIPTLQPDVAEWEPDLALSGGEDGLDICRRLLAAAPSFLEPSGRLLMEIGVNQASSVTELCEGVSGLRPECVHRDLGGIPRVFEAIRE